MRCVSFPGFHDKETLVFVVAPAVIETGGNSPKLMLV